MTKAAKDSSSCLVAGFHRNFPQDSKEIVIVSRGKATFVNRGGYKLSLTSRTLNVAEILNYLIEFLISNRIPLVGQILVSRIGNVG